MGRRQVLLALGAARSTLGACDAAPRARQRQRRPSRPHCRCSDLPATFQTGEYPPAPLSAPGFPLTDEAKEFWEQTPGLDFTKPPQA